MEGAGLWCRALRGIQFHRQEQRDGACWGALWVQALVSRWILNIPIIVRFCGRYFPSQTRNVKAGWVPLFKWMFSNRCVESRKLRARNIPATNFLNLI